MILSRTIVLLLLVLGCTTQTTNANNNLQETPHSEKIGLTTFSFSEKLDTLYLPSMVHRQSLELSSDQEELIFCDLMEGEEYTFYVNNFSGADCLPEIKSSHKIFKELSSQAFQFIAEKSCANFILAKPKADKIPCTEILNIIISIDCTSCISTTTEKNMMGILTDDTPTPQELVEDVFIGGNCFDVDSGSIQFSGAANARGSFSSGQAGINIEEGVMLSTGNIQNASGPNASYNEGNSGNGIGYDPDLAQLIGSNSTSVYDIASLEFDFTPTSDQLSFEFVFASEEYCEYVGSSFNDVFGFFISGPGINGSFSNDAINIARVPNSSSYIAINSVNYTSNSSYYVGNLTQAQLDALPSSLSCNNYPFPAIAAATDYIEFDGFTTVLTAETNVQACETYHIKLIIADVTDAYFDSAVFLKANSFSAGGAAFVTAEVPDLGANSTYENCTDAFFVFERADTLDLTSPLTVTYSISNLSTATEGLDYGVLPTSITIPAGQTTFTLPIDIFQDVLIEGDENIILELDAPCSCSIPFTEMIISDLDEITASMDNQMLCDANSISLTPILNGGLPGYTYEWNTGESEAEIFVSPTATTTYVLTVTDACGNTVESSSTIEIVSIPEASISGQVQICEGASEAELEVILLGSGPWDFTYSLNNSEIFSIENVIESPYNLMVNEIGTYELLSVQTGTCAGLVNGTALVEPTSFDLQIIPSPNSCTDTNDGSIDLTVSGGVAPYTYAWDNGLAPIEDPTNLAEGTYTVVISDLNSCTSTTNVEVLLDAGVPIADAGLGQTIDCNFPNVNLNAGNSSSSGLNYTYAWSTIDGSILEGLNNMQALVGAEGLYIFAVTNTQTNCTITDTVYVDSDLEEPTAIIIPVGATSINCVDAQVVLDGTSSLPFGNIDFEWTSEDGTVSPEMEDTPNTEAQSQGMYTLTVIDQNNGCTNTQNITIDADLEYPIVEIEMPNQINCFDSIVQINASNSSFGSSFQMTWSGVNIIDGENTLLPTVEDAGFVTLNIQNVNNGCITSETVEILADVNPPFAEAGAVQELDCNTLVANLDASTSSQGLEYSYVWTTTNGSISDGINAINPTVNSAGLYQLQVFNSNNGCLSFDEVMVFENTNVPREADIIPTSPLCFGELGSVEIPEVIGGLEPYVYSYDNGESYISETEMHGLAPGWHTIFIEDADGCEYSEEFFIPNALEINVWTEPFIDIHLGESAELDAHLNIPLTRVDSITWTPSNTLSCTDCLNPLANPIENTRYTIGVVDTNGCAANADILLRVDKQRSVFIPNAFSPDGDGVNDIFFINSDEYSIRTIRQFQIFNRWGEQLYDAFNFPPNDFRHGWDGTSHGKKLNPSVFVYFAEIEFLDGAIEIFKGDVTMLR